MTFFTTSKSGTKDRHAQFRNIKKQLQACESESNVARITPAWSADWIDRIRGVARNQHNVADAPRASEGAFNVAQQVNSCDCTRYSLHRTCGD